MNAGAIDISGGNHQLLDVLKRYPDFGRILDQLAAEWKFESLIHGDIKWDNCVLVPSDDGKVTLKLVDWELADWGDPCWDVAAIFSAFLVFWIQSIPLMPGGDVTQAMAQAQYPIEKMQPAINAFWRAYTDERQLQGSAAQALLRRSVLLCGARTVQTAYEYVQSSPQLNPITFLILQASLNILTKPAEATTELLGLTIQ
jgi:aminoglycoside phosphotransferase (APT) family kinase protein